MESRQTADRPVPIVDPERYQRVWASYGRCCLVDGFYRQFYARFLLADPRVAPYFAQTDMSEQRRLLKHGLAMVIGFAAGKALPRLAMDRLRKSHGRGQLAVLPELYDVWMDSLVATVADLDPEASPALLEDWRATVAGSTDYIRAGYAEDPAG